MQSPSSTSDAGFRLARCARRVCSASRFLCCSLSSLLSSPERVKMADPSVSPLEQVVQALNVLYTDPDRTAKDKANTWLADFQKSVRAALARARSGGRGPSRGSRLLRVGSSDTAGPNGAQSSLARHTRTLALSVPTRSRRPSPPPHPPARTPTRQTSTPAAAHPTDSLPLCPPE